MNSTKAIRELWKVIGKENCFESVLKKINVVSAGDGKCTAEMTVEEEHTNHGGTLHGGITASMVDIITSMAILTSKGVVGVSVDLRISYSKAAPLGQQIVMEAKTNKVGKNLVFADIIIKEKETGELVATGNHTTFVGS